MNDDERRHFMDGEKNSTSTSQLYPNGVFPEIYQKGFDILALGYVPSPLKSSKVILFPTSKRNTLLSQVFQT